MTAPFDHRYFQFRDHLAADVRAGLVQMKPAHLVARAATCGNIDIVTASEWTERFLADLKRPHHTRSTTR